VQLAQRVTALWESFNVELNFRRSARDQTYLQYATTKVSSEVVWIKATILTAGHNNHLMATRTNVVVMKLFAMLIGLR